MKILVNGKEAVLKTGSSFEYVSENPLFTEAEDYTLEIEFPMKDCPENILIFGALHVKGVNISTVTFPCRITTESFNKSGILTITEVNDVSVKAQFLEGMSTQQFDGDNLRVYIDEIDYSAIDGTDGVAEHVADAMGSGWVDLPVWDSDKEDVYSDQNNNATYRHIYLYHLVDFIAQSVGITVNYNNLPSWFSRLVVCNTTNYIKYVNGYGRYGLKGFMQLNKTLPHWTVKEFFKEIAKLYGFILSIDSQSNRVLFTPAKYYIYGEEELKVVDEFKVEQQEASGEYLKAIKVKLPDECNPDNINICPWMLEENILAMTEVRGKLEDQQYSTTYAATHNDDISAVLKTTALYQLYDQYNLFAGYIAFTDIQERSDLGGSDKEHFIQMELLNQYWSDPEGEELKVIPCTLQTMRIKHKYYGKWCKIDTDGEYTETNSAISIPYKMPVIQIKGLSIDQLYSGGYSAEDLRKAKEGELDEKYDKLFVVLHSGSYDENGYNLNTRKWEPVYGTEYAQQTINATGGDVPTYHTGFMVYGATITPYSNEVGQNFFQLPQVDETKLYRYKFLASSLPSATAIYVIKGKRYACLRLTAHFTTKGMSELIEGEFYEIVG